MININFKQNSEYYKNYEACNEFLKGLNQNKRHLSIFVPNEKIEHIGTRKRRPRTYLLLEACSK